MIFGKKWDNHGIIMDFMEIYWGYPNSWMVYFMENPNLKWMIFGKKMGQSWDNHVNIGIILW